MACLVAEFAHVDLQGRYLTPAEFAQPVLPQGVAEIGGSRSVKNWQQSGFPSHRAKASVCNNPYLYKDTLAASRWGFRNGSHRLRLAFFGLGVNVAGMKNFFRVVLSLGVLAGLVLLERKRPLRRERESKLRRNSRNLIVASLGALTVHLLEAPVIWPLAHVVERKRFGLLKRLGLPRPLEIIVSVVLMDYTLYLWHVLTHRIPFLWRFHAVHHVDLDLDASTALRFHFGELAVSVPYRAAQVVLLGVDAEALTYWQMFLSLSILFHHSNVYLPRRLESALSWLLVTPRMHGIHHSNEPAEANANWSSGLACWDRIHRTFRLDVPQEQIHIGVKGIDTEERVQLPEILTQPFRDVPEVTAFLLNASAD
jgi:sterol desaturase/sphingolipid hydroxylase (fatty acid hydroxylase superfamily)